MPDRPEASLIDLRSDGVSRPTAAMREAMMAAVVGDDQFGDDPCVTALERRVAALLGKPEGLFVASGTMANQVALAVLTRPGDEVVVGGEAHLGWHETGAAASNSGVQIRELGRTGRFHAAELESAIKPRGHAIFPPTGLVVVENTHNRGGGIFFPLEEMREVCAVADRYGIPTLLDGARLFNAACATGDTVAVMADPFRMAWIALSKGLGAPAGSILAGTADDIALARRMRRRFGGAMRQVGFLAAAGTYALDHHVERLSEDHANAARVADILAASGAFAFERATVQTNIVVAHLADAAPDAATLVANAREHGVLILAFGARTIRVTTHLDVDRTSCEAAARLLVELAEGSRSIA